MKVIGVELKGNDAILCLLALDEGLFSIPDCRSRKLSVNDPNDAQQLQSFQSTFAKLVEDYGIEKVVIRTRPTRGKFAGGFAGFKLEAILQVCQALNIELISSQEVKELLKRNELTIEFKETGLKKFQEQAFYTAFAWLSR